MLKLAFLQRSRPQLHSCSSWGLLCAQHALGVLRALYRKEAVQKVNAPAGVSAPSSFSIQ